MRTTTAVLAGGLAAVAGLFAGTVHASRPEPVPAPACSVAFVNLNRVFEGYKQRTEIEKALQEDFEGLKTALATREKDLKEAMNSLTAQFEPGSPEYDKERKRIALAERELEIDRIQATENLRRKEVRGMARVYKEIAAEAERIARERGFTAVLTVDSEPIQIEEKGQVIGKNDLKIQLALRTVLWGSAESDLTDAVLEALNK